MMQSLKNPSFSTWIAYGSFCIGTLFFGSHYLFPTSFDLFLYGFYYVIFALIVNLLLLFYLFSRWFEFPEQQKETKNEILILISNIPIAFTYFFILIFTI